MNHEHLTTLSQIQNAIIARLGADLKVRDGGVNYDYRRHDSVIYDAVFVSRATVIDLRLRNYTESELTIIAPNGTMLGMGFLEHSNGFPEIFEVVLRPLTQKA